MPTQALLTHSVLQSVKARDADGALVARALRCSRYCAVAAALLGLLVLCGWLLDIAALKSVLPQWVMMKPNTALGFLLAGLALLVPPARRGRRWLAAPLLATALMLLGGLTLLEYGLALDLGIDQLLFPVPHDANSGAPAGRMAVATALGFVSTGLALLLRATRRHRFGFQAAANMGNAIGLLAIVGYAYDVHSLYGVFTFSTVAIHTAIGFVVINTGTLLSRPQAGLLGVLTSSTVGGVMARRMVPLAVLLPLLIGWLRLQAGHLHWVDVDMGIAMITVTYVVVFLLLIWRIAEALRQSDMQRLAGDEVRQFQGAQMSGIINSAMDAIIMVNAAQRIVIFNPAAELMFGHAAQDMLNQPLDRLLPENARAEHAAHVRNFDATGSTQRRMGGLGLVTGLRASGEAFSIEASISKLALHGETYYTVILRDVTARNQLEARLRSTAARMQMAVRSTGIGIWVWHLDSDRLDWDSRMLEIYGAPDSLRETRLYYAYWIARVHPDDVPAVEQKLAAHVAGTGTYDVEFRIVREDGCVRHIHAVGILELDDTGRGRQLVGTNRDITEAKQTQIRISEINASLELQVAERTQALKELNATLEEKVLARSAELSLARDAATRANNAKSEFLANMSHEIRTPLNGILGLAYLLDKQALSPVGRDMVRKINGSGKSLLGIINDILDFSKIEAKHLQIEDVPFRLSDILDNLADVLSPAVGKKDLEVVVGGAPLEADYLRGDPLRLGQVLLNLTSNAIKFTPRGEVVLRIENRPVADPGRRCLHFLVRDTGVGIGADMLERIFQPFSQADSSTTRNFGGTGLGLTISSQLVQLMGGALQVQSQPERGSEFSFTLEFGSSEPSRNATPALAHQNVLVVEDNAAARLMLQEAGRSLGWHVDAVDSGEDALALYRQLPQPRYDVLLVDWRMPGLSGLQTIAQLLPFLPAPKVPAVVMVTSYDREELMADPLSHYADVVVSKPLTASALFNAVVEAKSHHGLLDPRQHTAGSGQRLDGIRVMVVDDSEINRDVALDILAGEGALVDVACDGAEALIRLSNGPANYDLVLMDVQMPVMDGYEATRQIRLHPALRHLPVVALTAGALKNQQDSALQCGMDAFVPKPFDVDQLLDTIARLVQERGLAVRAPLAAAGSGAAAALAVVAGGNAMAAPEALPWEDLPLLDVAAAQRKWRRSDTLARHLQTFVRTHGDDAARMHALWQAGQRSALLSAAHKLRGSAGALSLQRCMALAAALEDALLADPGTQQPGAWLEALQQVLPTTSARIADYLQTQAPGPVQPAPARALAAAGDSAARAQARRALLQQLREAVRSDDPAMVEQHLPALAQWWPGAELQQLQTLLDGFDFAAVSQWIARMEQEPEPEEPETTT
jgi:PAS domain S-box-containing protein